MTFFTSDTPDGDQPGADRPVWAVPAPSRGEGRRWIGWLLILTSVVIVIVLAFTPSPYVIEKPGPVYDTLGSVGAGTDAKPLISISGAETYPTSGSLDLLTVSVAGNPDAPASFFEVALSWFDRSRSVQPLDAIYRPGVSTEQQQEQSRTQMVNSQQEAVAAALREVGYTVTGRVSIAAVPDGAPASGVLEVGDVVTSVDGSPVQDLPDLRAKLAENGTSKPATIGVDRGGAPLTFDITPTESNGVAVLGVGVTVAYDFPIDVDIELPNVGGPSAGMMFALGIYDKLTAGELTGGAAVAGTGTIDAAGTVGPIGGIRQKLYAARDAGASLFLAPQGNCDEVEGHIPDGISVVAVTDLEDALDAVKTFASTRSTAGLPSCESVEG